MTNINTQNQLRNYLQTAEAFNGEPFNYKGFHIWWNEECDSVQTPTDGYFRCDPYKEAHYREFNKLMEKGFADFDWLLS